MPENQVAQLSGFVGIDLNAAAETLPQGKLRRAFGVDLGREAGAIRIRRGQAATNATAVSIWTPLHGFTCPGDAKHVNAPAWRFTLDATGGNFSTQPWENPATADTAGQTVGVFGWEGTNHGATNVPQSAVVSAVMSLGSARYQRIGQCLYKGMSDLDTGYSSARSQAVTYRPLGDTDTWLFIADQAQMRKTNGTVARNWGITPPSLPADISGTGAGPLVGTYTVRYTYLRKAGDVVVAESAPSPVSQSSSPLSSTSLSVKNLQLSTDPQVTHIRIYRTVGNGAVHLFDQDTGADTTSLTSGTADAALGQPVELDNLPPPKTNLAAMHNESVFLDGDPINPGFLWFTKRFRPESMPQTNFLEMNASDPGRAIVSLGGHLIRFTRDTKYRIIGTDPSNYQAIESPSRRGILTGKAWAVGWLQGAFQPIIGVYYLSSDGVYFTDGMLDVEASHDIRPLFRGQTVASHPPVNVSGNHVADFFRGKFRLAYASGSSTDPDYLAIYDVQTRAWQIEPMTVMSLYHDQANGALVRGATDGFEYLMEQERTDDAGANISVDVLTGEIAGQVSWSYKIFSRFDVEADPAGGTITSTFLLDGSAQDTASLTGSGRALYRPRVSSGRLGLRGALRFQYTGQADIRISAARLFFSQLGLT